MFMVYTLNKYILYLMFLVLILDSLLLIHGSYQYARDDLVHEHRTHALSGNLFFARSHMCHQHDISSFLIGFFEREHLFESKY